MPLPDSLAGLLSQTGVAAEPFTTQVTSPQRPKLSRPPVVMVSGSSLPFAPPLHFQLLARTAHCPGPIGLSSTPDGRARLRYVVAVHGIARPTHQGTPKILVLRGGKCTGSKWLTARGCGIGSSGRHCSCLDIVSGCGRGDSAQSSTLGWIPSLSGRFARLSGILPAGRVLSLRPLLEACTVTPSKKSPNHTPSVPRTKKEKFNPAC
ncbi:hypothetical protein BO78DRAFT_218237 [Aspergillus sclerotiicarbonarius CBS 121057]|uniref:Uncharacterized protein n=1 Tax=Aspergillus sclerotiicarbonarius (strain CBS 121057 / IBT 28362) TaxID=1448318 RepID=A0A319ELX6_ASPSB|nr:hypothetical protein BO78DRAFT_218237 [Aspergillus sclerotiicarbonarius CBS 121057]